MSAIIKNATQKALHIVAGIKYIPIPKHTVAKTILIIPKYNFIIFLIRVIGRKKGANGNLSFSNHNLAIFFKTCNPILNKIAHTILL